MSISYIFSINFVKQRSSRYNIGVSKPEKLITDYQYELVEDHHSFGSGRYGLRVMLPKDISPAFPYLNAVLDDTIYDHENSILIGFSNKKRYAFRPHEIQLGMVADPLDVSGIIEEVVDLVNKVWKDRNNIKPSLTERKIPPVFEIYKMLPGTNCKECGCLTCLVFASDLRSGKVKPEVCVKLSDPEYKEARDKIYSIFTQD
jgi:ArsR family metal-binding transcriptional regulator